MSELETKERRLFEALEKTPSLIVAYSGGVDSAYLAYAAHRALGGRMPVANHPLVERMAWTVLGRYG